MTFFKALFNVFVIFPLTVGLFIAGIAMIPTLFFPVGVIFLIFALGLAEKMSEDDKKRCCCKDNDVV